MVYVMPPVLFAAMSDRLIAVIRRDRRGGRSGWPCYIPPLVHACGAVDRQGCPLALLNATPLPGSAERPAIEPPGGDTPAASNLSPTKPEGERNQARRSGTKTARFLAEVQQRYGGLDGIGLDKVGRACTEIAPLVDLNVGSARTVLRTAILAAQAGGAR